MSILGIIRAGLEIWNRWFGGYGSKEATKAREENDKQKKLDAFTKAEKEGDLDEIRKRLSDRNPS